MGWARCIHKHCQLEAQDVCDGCGFCEDSSIRAHCVEAWDTCTVISYTIIDDELGGIACRFVLHNIISSSSYSDAFTLSLLSRAALAMSTFLQS